jgi:hydroxymethylbilane synthase
MSEKFVIGSRGSDLALWQANYVKTSLEKHFPDDHFEIKIIHTTGDQVIDTALSKIGDKGLFTKQIEAELLDESIDIAVHSLKDLQTAQPDGLMIGAVCERETPNDVLVSRAGWTIEELPEAGRVATGSLRRRSQLLHYRSDLRVEEIRGNIPTRLRKFQESDLDGMILAFAGLHRLGLGQYVMQLIPFEIMLPAVGQGAVAVEIRESDGRTRKAVEKLDHGPTRTCITAERAFLRCLEGGCQVPIGAFASLDGESVMLEGMVGSLDGTVVFRERISGRAERAEELGTKLADSLIKLGAREVLDNTREQASASSQVTM